MQGQCLVFDCGNPTSGAKALLCPLHRKSWLAQEEVLPLEYVEAHKRKQLSDPDRKTCRVSGCTGEADLGKILCPKHWQEYLAHGGAASQKDFLKLCRPDLVAAVEPPKPPQAKCECCDSAPVANGRRCRGHRAVSTGNCLVAWCEEKEVSTRYTCFCATHGEAYLLSSRQTYHEFAASLTPPVASTTTQPTQDGQDNEHIVDALRYSMESQTHTPAQPTKLCVHPGCEKPRQTSVDRCCSDVKHLSYPHTLQQAWDKRPGWEWLKGFTACCSAGCKHDRREGYLLCELHFRGFESSAHPTQEAYLLDEIAWDGCLVHECKERVILPEIATSNAWKESKIRFNAAEPGACLCKKHYGELQADWEKPSVFNAEDCKQFYRRWLAARIDAPTLPIPDHDDAEAQVNMPATTNIKDLVITSATGGTVAIQVETSVDDGSWSKDCSIEGSVSFSPSLQESWADTLKKLEERLAQLNREFAEWKKPTAPEDDPKLLLEKYVEGLGAKVGDLKSALEYLSVKMKTLEGRIPDVQGQSALQARIEKQEKDINLLFTRVHEWLVAKPLAKPCEQPQPSSMTQDEILKQIEALAGQLDHDVMMVPRGPLSLDEILKGVGRLTRDSDKVVVVSDYRRSAYEGTDRAFAVVGKDRGQVNEVMEAWLATKEAKMEEQQGPKKLATQEENKGQTESKAKEVLKTLEGEAKEAGYRLAARQFIKITREPLIALLAKNLDPNDPSLRVKVAAFLDTDLGEALISMMLSLGLQSLPESTGEIPKRLARELRVNGMLEVGTVVSDLLLDPLLKVTNDYLRGVQEPLALPTETQLANPKVTLNGLNGVHQHTETVATAKAR